MNIQKSRESPLPQKAANSKQKTNYTITAQTKLHRNMALTRIFSKKKSYPYSPQYQIKLSQCRAASSTKFLYSSETKDFTLRAGFPLSFWGDSYFIPITVAKPAIQI
jgi:hypothetical protein